MPIPSLFPPFFMSHGQFGFFDREQQLEKIYQLNNFLPKLNSLIPWEVFRPTLQKVREKKHHGTGGHLPSMSYSCSKNTGAKQNSAEIFLRTRVPGIWLYRLASHKTQKKTRSPGIVAVQSMTMSADEFVA